MERLLSLQVHPFFYTMSGPELIIQSQNQIVGIDDRNNWNELQGNLCSVLIVSWYLFHRDPSHEGFAGCRPQAERRDSSPC